MNINRFANKSVSDNIRSNKKLQAMIKNCQIESDADKLIAIRTE